MNPRRSPVPVHLPAHGVCVWESQHDHGFQMVPEAHPFAELFYVLDGTGTFAIGGTAHPCAAGDVVVVPAGARHAIEDGPRPLALYGIGVSAELLRTDPDARDRLAAGPVGSRSVAARVRAGVRRMLFEQTEARPGHRAVAVGQALQLLAAVARAPAPAAAVAPDANRRAVERFVAELGHRFYEPVSTDRAAAELDLSRRSFTRLFRAAAGCPYAEYVERVRIAYAQRLLRDTAREIASIAFECGYEELSSFYRAFRRQARTAPGRWREAQRAPGAQPARGPIRKSD